MASVIREPVWGDVVFDELEAAIIDTKEMQRLRWIRQLGTACVVYPGATHSKFQHSLGTCHVAGRIFDAAMKNKDPDIDMTPEDRALVRLLGLLHDILHIAFGHILVDELRMFDKETHDTGERLKLFLDAIAKDPRVQSAIPDSYPPDLFETITHMLASEPDDLSRPFLLEIVKDTVCADLLDYLRRDYYYLGIQRVYDDRTYDYFSVAEHEGKPHLIVELTENGRRAEDSLTELYHLLRIRYTLAERVYFHETKLAFDAMLDKAVYHSELRQQRSRIDALGDEGLLNYLENTDPCPLVNQLGKLLKARDHYRPAYMVSCEKKGGRRRWQPFMVADERRKAERRIAEEAGPAVKYEELAIFCPDWGMSMKEADVRVRDEQGDIHALKKHTESDARRINQQHQRLWRFYAYSIEDTRDVVADTCEDIFGCKNEYLP